MGDCRGFCGGGKVREGEKVCRAGARCGGKGELVARKGIIFKLNKARCKGETGLDRTGLDWRTKGDEQERTGLDWDDWTPACFAGLGWGKVERRASERGSEGAAESKAKPKKKREGDGDVDVDIDGGRASNL